MEKLSPKQTEARTKAMLAYLKGITEQGYDVTVIPKGASPNNPNNAHLAFALAPSDIKTAPQDIKRIFPVPQEKQQKARRYETTIVLPQEGKNTVMWFFKPITGNHSSDFVSYGLQLHAASTELEWLKLRIEAKKRVPQTALE